LIVQSSDPSLLREVCEVHKDIVGNFDSDAWLLRPGNIMYVDEDSKSVAFANFEYPGVYTVHWFFTVHGREAIDLADAMATKLFKETDAKALRGLTRSDLRHAKITARRLGMKPYGTIIHDNREYEILCMTKDEFYNKRQGINNG
jgi:hypothetical protein